MTAGKAKRPLTWGSPEFNAEVEKGRPNELFEQDKQMIDEMIAKIQTSEGTEYLMRSVLSYF